MSKIIAGNESCVPRHQAGVSSQKVLTVQSLKAVHEIRSATGARLLLEFVPQGLTVSVKRYCKAPRHWRVDIWSKRPDL